jgi:PRP38 family
MPSEFMCLILKLLQIQPDPEVIREYILQEDSKYLRLLGAFYLRLTGKADQVQLPYNLHTVSFCFLDGTQGFFMCSICVECASLCPDYRLLN